MFAEDMWWAKSAKGNWWYRLNGHVLVAGLSDYGFWASCDGVFLEGPYRSQEDAQRAAERVAENGGVA